MCVSVMSSVVTKKASRPENRSCVRVVKTAVEPSGDTAKFA